MTMSNESKEHNSTQPKPDFQSKPDNPMKSVQTKPLPTKMVFFNEHEKKKEGTRSSGWVDGQSQKKRPLPWLQGKDRAADIDGDIAKVGKEVI